MADRNNEEVLNRLIAAFRKELDLYSQELTSDGGSRSARHTVTNGSPRRVVLDDTPSYHTTEDEPKPVQTPYVSRRSPSRHSAASSPRASPSPGRQQLSASSPSGWKTSLNHIVDTIEDCQSRMASLSQENDTLRGQVDTLSADYATLQEDYQQLKAHKLQSVEEENAELRQIVQELREQQKKFKEEHEEQLLDAREKLRDLRTEREKMERQNDKLHDRIRDYESAAATPAPPSNSSRRGGGGYTTSSRSNSGRYNNNGNGGSSQVMSPGHALVRDLTETTGMEQERLAPLQDILDQRLGRKATPGRYNA